jgi:hydrogenase maturation protein HypF
MPPVERRAICVRGTVQGVGFRPFIYGLAARLEIKGCVSNVGGDVSVEIEGPTQRLDRFLDELVANRPPLAHIESVTWTPQGVRGDQHFSILKSETSGRARVTISPDVATCGACVAELFDPLNRRYRYPFLNCTNCGPRITIVTGAPYDRIRTTMASFGMCDACRAEYEDPNDRRFHAQPTACAACGPRLVACDSTGSRLEVGDAVAWFVDQLRRGAVGAVKGLGGYHLACDAGNDLAVSQLRARKHRDEKPFALMVMDVPTADVWCEISPEERALLTSAARPIVLVRKRDPHSFRLIAPGNPHLGVMLPYTPLHHLLLREIGRPLVMTSGNRSDEPIAYTEPEVFERLRGIADVFLTHDRPIHTRCDDSVMRVARGEDSPVRRSRGYAPHPIQMPVTCSRPVLAVGGQLKNTFALGRDDRAIVSHHMGDLGHFEAYRSFERDVAGYEELFSIRPRVIAHDLHPDYASTRYAVARVARDGLIALPIQHHHAHIAACFAEHGMVEPVIGVAFDGTGFGTDGNIWGGEFLVGDLVAYRRAAHFSYVPMPGGERAIREPWRMAVAHLSAAGVECAALSSRIDAAATRTVRQMIDKQVNCPLTSSVGRLFDAVASLVGVRDRVTFEGQAAMQLEWLGADLCSAENYPYEIDKVARPMQIDTRPLIRAVAEDVDRGTTAALISRRFHSTLAAITADVCTTLGQESGIRRVVLSGGVFMNALLAREVSAKLAECGFSTFQHRRVPPNDGGLSFGQLAIASQILQAK